MDEELLCLSKQLNGTKITRALLIRQNCLGAWNTLIPTSAVLGVNGLTLAVEPLAWSPVLLVSPEGAVRFPRAMARVRAGLRIGWIEEFNQPPG